MLKQLFLGCLVAFPAFLFGQVAPEEVVDWSDSPARNRLAEIQPYKPEVRRNRSAAISELNAEVAAFKRGVTVAQKEYDRQARLARKKSSSAWSVEQLGEAEGLLEEMWASLAEMQTYLDEVNGSNEPILKYLERKQASQALQRIAPSSGGADDEEFDDIDEDSEAAALRKATLPSSASKPGRPSLPPPPEEREPDED